MTQIQEIAQRYLEQHYFVGNDGLLYTPVGRVARDTIRIGRNTFPAASVAAEMQRLLKTWR